MARSQAGEVPARTWRRKSDIIMGTSPGIRRVLAALDRLAPSNAPVLVTGESGTGKELVARALHYSGPRSAEPFLSVNCAAIPETLFESELFGYQRGAFTGAVTTRTGIFEAAGGGTVLLDELGEMPLSLQPKLLRVLETGEVTRLGSNEPRQVSCRVVFATNRDLRQEVKAGRFREDLFYRVSVFVLHLPPLRERPEDIPPIVFHHLSEFCEREHRAVPKLTPEALKKLLSFHWPGNVRELVNVLQRAVLLAEEGPIDAAHIELPGESSPLIRPYSEAKAAFERAYWEQVLSASRGNISQAAKLSKKTRKEVYDALRKLELDPARFRPGGAAS